VHPIRRVAVLLMIQGLAEIVLGLVYGAFVISARRDEAVALGLVPREMVGVVTVLAALLVAGGLLKLAAGIRNHAYRDRTLGLVALASSVVSLPTCVCAPTGIALLAYGLRVYARPWPGVMRAIDTPRVRT
jgi:hypothetical protein